MPTTSILILLVWLATSVYAAFYYRGRWRRERLATLDAHTARRSTESAMEYWQWVAQRWQAVAERMGAVGPLGLLSDAKVAEPYHGVRDGFPDERGLPDHFPIGTPSNPLLLHRVYDSHLGHPSRYSELSDFVRRVVP